MPFTIKKDKVKLILLNIQGLYIDCYGGVH